MAGWQRDREAIYAERSHSRRPPLNSCASAASARAHGGTTSLDALIARGLTPPTRYVRTGSGGLHLYYRHPGGISVPCDQGMRLGPGIDVKADGGYVVAPPSRHPVTGVRTGGLIRGRA
ncbi:hypothetical protein CS0771_47390 [Catellatospora sp. IY07-71]|uniref:bifunctional DNA primase/polymerase n=1 Tax=Catellatospora sp. IY07-71 TaxID=2728827 RepID=UPI001BB67224|nr:bifunctional DNA primase/polymerase [Catellatospora sp. IY07-71]BCJ75195.1 hypothetical protein CS0771_47390 [Catellatospora sp. IY07-71]